MRNTLLSCAAGLAFYIGAVIPAQALDHNLQFSGTLVSEPCTLDPQTTDLDVNFQSIVRGSFFLYTRTSSVPFTINLTGCDVTLGDKVTITFAGTESSALPGYLAVTGAATGVAIGMETPEGTPLPFNKPTPEYTLSPGTNSLTLHAFLQGEPDAIAQQTITSGDFTATATFELNYP
ncbi:fimbrial protein [Atlantibacter sp. RC6]|uniref:fimbrial protein n=1 Tax=Atlantibacter sp. RC6 TaxID=2587036 RepID=UPI0016058E29|nr:fimbrial protein [Atlantibacter sp. RC6]MBB3320760.1 type 1 fimbria pilin [Atlantibacter sp. RC6]